MSATSTQADVVGRPVDLRRRVAGVRRRPWRRRPGARRGSPRHGHSAPYRRNACRVRRRARRPRTRARTPPRPRGPVPPRAAHRGRRRRRATSRPRVVGALREPRQQHRRSRDGSARRPRSAGAGRAVVDQRLTHHRHHRHASRRATLSSGCQAASIVEPSTSMTRGSGESDGTHASYTIRSAWKSVITPSREARGRWAE